MIFQMVEDHQSVTFAGGMAIFCPGRIAHHVSSYTGAHVTGLNIDKEQIRQAG